MSFGFVDKHILQSTMYLSYLCQSPCTKTMTEILRSTTCEYFCRLVSLKECGAAWDAFSEKNLDDTPLKFLQTTTF